MPSEDGELEEVQVKAVYPSPQKTGMRPKETGVDINDGKTPMEWTITPAREKPLRRSGVKGGVDTSDDGDGDRGIGYLRPVSKRKRRNSAVIEVEVVTVALYV